MYPHKPSGIGLGDAVTPTLVYGGSREEMTNQQWRINYAGFGETP